MSPNYGNTDYGYQAGSQSSFLGRTKGFTGGMDLPPSRFSNLSQSNQPETELASMSTVALRAQVLPAPSDVWKERRTLELPSGPNSQTDRIELPPIRQVFSLFPLLLTIWLTDSGGSARD